MQGAINDGFAKFTEALFVAEQRARQAVELRSKVQQEIAHREKAAKDAELRSLAIRCTGPTRAHALGPQQCVLPEHLECAMLRGHVICAVMPCVCEACEMPGERALLA